MVKLVWHNFEEGDASFIDLDGDGEDEWIIAFAGLHLSWPDLGVIRTQQGSLKYCPSVVEPIRRSIGDFARLITDQNPPVIRISNTMDEQAQSYDYVYDPGRLHLKEP